MISNPLAAGGGRLPVAQAELALPPRAGPAPVSEWVINVVPRGGEATVAVFERLAGQLCAAQAEITHLLVFGAVSAQAGVDRAMRDGLGEVTWPVTWVEGASCGGEALAGVQAFAVSGRPVTRVRLGSRVVASVYDDGDARHCVLGGIGPNSLALRAPAQVQQMFGNLECALDLAGFTFSDVVRTWFYNDDLLSWYDDFNRVRSAHYANIPWRTGSLPASTGVAARNPAGAALAVAAWAVRPLSGRSWAREVASPLQCPAPQYGSSFSRAMEVGSGGWRRLAISGTASIYPQGNTAFVGNAKKQVDLTMEVVAAILQSRGMDFGDATRAVAYFKHPLFQAYFDAWCGARFLHLPVVPVQCDICRDDLLFEIEMDARRPEFTPGRSA